jgi:hypothetical protein
MASRSAGTMHDKKKIYTYDSIKHNGHPYEEQNGSFKTHI